MRSTAQADRLLAVDDGQVERRNRKIKDATVERFPRDDRDPLRSFVAFHDFGRRLEPHGFFCKPGPNA